MYTIKLLAPILLSACAEDFLSKTDYVCRRSQPSTSRIKYYEPGKACYIEGVFHESCPKIK